MKRADVEALCDRLGAPGIGAREIAEAIIYIRRMPWGDGTLDEYLPDLGVALARRVLGITKVRPLPRKGRGKRRVK